MLPSASAAPPTPFAEAWCALPPVPPRRMVRGMRATPSYLVEPCDSTPPPSPVLTPVASSPPPDCNCRWHRHLWRHWCIFPDRVALLAGHVQGPQLDQPAHHHRHHLLLAHVADHLHDAAPPARQADSHEGVERPGVSSSGGGGGAFQWPWDSSTPSSQRRHQSLHPRHNNNTVGGRVACRSAMFTRTCASMGRDLRSARMPDRGACQEIAHMPLVHRRLRGRRCT